MLIGLAFFNCFAGIIAHAQRYRSDRMAYLIPFRWRLTLAIRVRIPSTAK
jgi:hypothetical protein